MQVVPCTGVPGRGWRGLKSSPWSICQAMGPAHGLCLWMPLPEKSKKKKKEKRYSCQDNPAAPRTLGPSFLLFFLPGILFLSLSLSSSQSRMSPGQCFLICQISVQISIPQKAFHEHVGKIRPCVLLSHHSALSPPAPSHGDSIIMSWNVSWVRAGSFHLLQH